MNASAISTDGVAAFEEAIRLVQAGGGRLQAARLRADVIVMGVTPRTRVSRLLLTRAFPSDYVAASVAEGRPA